MKEYLDYGMTNFLVALAEEYRARGFNVSYQPFFYSVDFLPLAASSTDTKGVTIENDADFIWCTAMQSVFSTSAFVQNPNVLSQVVIESSQRQLQNGFGHILNTWGTGQRPFPFFKPLVLAAKATVNVTLQDLTATVGGLNVRLTLGGVKAFLTQ